MGTTTIKLTQQQEDQFGGLRTWALSIPIFHWVIQFPPKHPHQILTCNLVRKMDDRLKRWDGAVGTASMWEQRWKDTGQSSFCRLFLEQNWRSIHRCASTPLASCRVAFLMRLHCVSLCMPYWTKPIGNQGESNIHWDTFRWRPQTNPSQSNRDTWKPTNLVSVWEVVRRLNILFSLENMFLEAVAPFS